jgi:hypothetical protein
LIPFFGNIRRERTERKAKEEASSKEKQDESKLISFLFM